MGSTIPSIDTSVINRQSMVSEVADYLQNYCSFISADTVEILFSQEVDGGDFFDLTDETLLTHFPNITFGQRKKIMFIVVAHKTSAGPDGGGSCTDDTLGCKPLVENNAGSSASSGTSLASYTIRKRVRKPKVPSDRKRRKEIDADSVDPIDVLAVLSSKKIGMNVIEFVRVHKRINKTHQENMMKMLYEDVSKDATSPEKYYPENSLKIAMAKGIVMAFPELKDDGDQPWKSWYKKVKTKFETLQAKLPPEKKKYQHVKGKEIDQQDNTNPEESSSSSSTDNSFSPESDNLLDNLVAWMNDAIPNTANKKEISLAVKSTFDMRTAWIKTESPSCSEILLKYKHLISYSGEMLYCKKPALFFL
ncbi:uncharacterized protein LOC117652683 [Thrips palmi]|uniref:Uncharacterized protein LOC117652683 n=1 Tax=Thrips palmi TaxID=161013 RepID=A0A6P9A7Z0_THRPL|nr:uncharacterized protein LOC117652683 [Thrips palmi]